MVSGNKALENLSHCFSVSFLLVWFFNLDMRCKLFSTIVRLIFLCDAMTGGQKLCCIYILDACLLEVSNPIQKKLSIVLEQTNNAAMLLLQIIWKWWKKQQREKSTRCVCRKKKIGRKERGGNGSYIWSVSLRGNA